LLGGLSEPMLKSEGTTVYRQEWIKVLSLKYRGRRLLDEQTGGGGGNVYNKGKCGKLN
jgi:hypothetical protein